MAFPVTKLEAPPLSYPTAMTGAFKSCIQGICRIISKIYFINNEVNKCFAENNEMGIYYYLENILTIAQLTGDYRIEPTKCTMTHDDAIETEGFDFKNFFRDPYEIIFYVGSIALLSLISIFLCFLNCKLKRRSSFPKVNRKEEITLCPAKPFASKIRNLQTINENYYTEPSAVPTTKIVPTTPAVPTSSAAVAPPSLPQPKNDAYLFEAPDRTVAETRGSMLTSTQVSYNNENLPSLTTSLNQTNSKNDHCTCHANKLVCSNCSCTRAERPCNEKCHIAKTSKKSKRSELTKQNSYICVNKFNNGEQN